MKRITNCIILILAGLLLAPSALFAQSQVNPYEGKLIKSPDSTAVYWVGPDQKRHAFPNQKIYFTWYKDFSLVVTVSPSELASYPLGKNVLYRPGSRLIKVPSVPEVYAVEPFGELRNLPSEEVARNLYGEDWADRVDDIDVSFFFDYTIGGTIETFDQEPVFPAGTVIGLKDKHFVVARRTDGLLLARPVSESAWTWNRFRVEDVRSFDDEILPSYFNIGASLLMPEAAYACVSCDANDFTMRSVQETSAHEQDGLSIEVPNSFRVDFINEGSTTFDAPLRAIESVQDENDNISENLLLLRWYKPQFGNDINQLIEIRKELADTIYYSGPSLSHSGAMELALGQDSGIIFRHVIFERGSYFYDVHFTSYEYEIDRYMDVLDLMIDTLQFPAD